jgi:uncharacterized protein (TIGR03435 family)
MLQNLLVERFKLTFHRAQEVRSGYELGVAKEGARLKEGSEAEPPRPGEAQRVNLGGNVAIRMAPGFATTGVTTFTRENVTSTAGRRATMEELARGLSTVLGEAVVDATGLKGRYDFTFTWSSGSPSVDPGMEIPVASTPQPTLEQAVRALGLRLERKKVAVDMLVIDRIEKAPAEN